MLTLGLIAGLTLMPLTALAEGVHPTPAGNTAAAQTTTSAGAITELGVLKGDGEGVTDAYLSKTTTRLQAAILQLRLIGKEQEAKVYTGMESFTDSDKVGKANRPILAYLKSHPEYGWSGTGTGRFEPKDTITSQQLYKVMLESLRFRSGADFTFKDTLLFASTLGLSRAAAATPFTNRDLAIALTETLQAMPKGTTHTLLHELVEQKVVAADKAMLLEGQRIDIQKTADGTMYFTDGKGMALYLYTKDMADLSSCQGACLTNWPIFYSDHLLLPDNLEN
jgi:hypothetical protein